LSTGRETGGTKGKACELIGGVEDGGAGITSGISLKEIVTVAMTKGQEELQW